MAASTTTFRSLRVFNCTIIVPNSANRIPLRSPCFMGQPFSHRVARTLRCSPETNNSNPTLKTCRNCKKQFDPLQNHPRACSYHTAHFGGETKRKFESVYTGGTMNTPDSGKISQYWHCCGAEDPFNLGCVAAPHSSYDD